MKNGEQGEKNGEQRMNEDNFTGFKKRLSAVEIYTYELFMPTSYLPVFNPVCAYTWLPQS